MTGALFCHDAAASIRIKCTLARMLNEDIGDKMPQARLHQQKSNTVDILTGIAAEAVPVVWTEQVVHLQVQALSGLADPRAD